MDQFSTSLRSKAKDAAKENKYFASAAVHLNGSVMRYAPAWISRPENGYDEFLSPISDGCNTRDANR